MSTEGGEQTKTRTPKCARCRNHGYTVNLRGHKGFCPHKSCTCELCDLVKERQEVSKRQIKLRRQQQQEEILGMYVPVPPSVFSQGSVYGINLDYLRVLFPRKRVDRLYAVLLQCSNDVNAATIKLQQEEHTGDTRESLVSLTTKATSTAPVMKINKATQWPVESNHRTEPPCTLGTVIPHPRARQKSIVKGPDDLQHTPSPHCPFPFCWSHAVPAQFTPIDSISVPSGDAFPKTSPRSLIKPDPFSLEPFSLDNSMALESCDSGVPGRGKLAVEPVPRAVSMAELPSVAQLPVTSSTLPSQAMDASDLQSTMSTCNQLGNITPKVSRWSGGPIYTSASNALSPWFDIPTSLPLPRMAAPFSLPPPPLPPFPPGWDPRSLPPLPYLPASMASILHSSPYSQGTSSFQVSPARLSHSSALPYVKEVPSSSDKAGEALTSSNDLILTAVGRSDLAVNADLSSGENDIDIVGVCSDSDGLINPTGFE